MVILVVQVILRGLFSARLYGFPSPVPPRPRPRPHLQARRGGIEFSWDNAAGAGMLPPPPSQRDDGHKKGMGQVLARPWAAALLLAAVTRPVPLAASRHLHVGAVLEQSTFFTRRAGSKHFMWR